MNSSARPTRRERARTEVKATRALREAEHPVVRTHPETGRKALYVNSRPHGALPRHDRGRERAAARLPVPPPGEAGVHLPLPLGEQGSLAFWDNRCTQHNPINDYHGHRRVMHRITLAGDRPS